MTLEEQIKANTQRMAELKQQMETAISDKGGVVTPSGDSPTFEEVIAGVGTIETGIEINGVQDIKATALSNIKKGDMCVVYLPKTDKVTDLKELGSFSMTKSKMLPLIIEDGKVIAHPYDDGNGYFYFYKLNDDGTYSKITASSTWWRDNYSKVFDRVTKRMVTKEASGYLRLWQLSDDYSSFTTIMENSKLFGKDAVFFAHNDNFFASVTNGDIGVYKYNSDTQTMTQASTVLTGTGLSATTLMLSDVFIVGGDIYTICIYNSTQLLVQKFSLTDGKYMSNGTYNLISTNTGLNVTFSSYSYGNKTTRPAIKFSKTGVNTIRLTTASKVVLSTFNPVTLAIENDTDIITDVKDMVTIGNYIFVEKLNPAEANQLFELYELNETTGEVKFLCYPIVEFDANITSLPYMYDMGTIYDNFWFKGLNGLVYKQFGKPTQENSDATIDKCNNFTQLDKETEFVSGYAVALDNINKGDVGALTKVLTTTQFDKNQINEQAIVVETQTESLTELQTLVDEKLS